MNSKHSMSFLFSSPIQIDILLDNDHEKAKMTKVVNKQKVDIPIYMRNEDVSGKVMVTLKDKKFEHQGIRIDFVGTIEYSYDRSSTSNFIQQTFELSRPTIMTEEKTMFPFNFSGIDKKYDSYAGKNVRLRYYLRVTVNKKYSSGMNKEIDIWVVNYQDQPQKNEPILMDVGVEKSISIEFKYRKSFYTLSDVVLGQVYFKTVRLPLASMELQILRKETTGYPPNQTVETETLARYELMDGAPVKGESMPIRVFLANLDLTPSYHNINNMFSVTYHLHLVLIEENSKRYFKQCEFKLWRKKPDVQIVAQEVKTAANTDGLAGCQEAPYKGTDGQNVNKPLPHVNEAENVKEDVTPVEEKPQIIEEAKQTQPIAQDVKQEVPEETKQVENTEVKKEEKKEESKSDKKENKPIDISSFIQDDKQEDENLF
ncbi:vacuolar protein sorting-associated protein, putative [Entamoeba invadens IP1]|uniref:Vacuolar protein sorting-associated protein, putative n=1 Tax=Entamoeba invadens IP1 TaxID=370355 RepID=A0A0A1UAG4_ENTIV|nr:vacuolar protein sorting-associated protein, putative [Entamoeba invadens IP1]ELP92012.1 vacuolar protein sorting-associated protein, putative [Entamoeba invadens IP1]|eukprot:XP_004258783.1 vacuolar protein sorting-associated protein, putative [Entamoeba invadens IP1]